MNYNTASQKTRSEKITLVTIESVEQVRLFTANASDWDRVTDYFVIGVKEDGVSIATWSYTPTTKTLKIIGGTDPKGRKISLTYRHFYSNAPINLPYDLATGDVVEWEGRVNSIGSIGQQLDDENTGIVLESSSSVDLINSDGFFDSFFDTHIWENQSIKFYSWFPDIPISERAQLFEGVIESKSFSDSRISFKVKDFVFKLKDKVNLGLFSEDDGVILPTLLGTAKRRIYGKADFVKCVGLRATLDGFLINGITSCAIDTNTLNGVGTSFLTQLSPGDELIYIIAGVTRKIAIESIASNTSLTLGKLIDFNIDDQTPKVRPSIPSRYRNRIWHVAHHTLRAPSTTISEVIANNRFRVVDVSDISAGDEILINGDSATVRRIANDVIVTEAAISPIPSFGDTVERLPISAVYYKDKKLAYSRDYIIQNNDITQARIVIDEKAEFYAFEEVKLSTIFSFTNLSRTVTTSATVDLRAILKTRDWIRSSEIDEPDWYEILEVKSNEIILRTIFTGATESKSIYYKNIEYIDDESLITVNCIGKDSAAGLWLRTPSDAVRDLILNDAGFALVNEASFAKAKADCNYTLSMVVPEDVGQGYPIIRDIITNINNSCFGALFGDSSQNISYSIFNATKPESIQPIKDDDIISFSVESTQRIINEAKISYRPYVDIYSAENSFKVVVHDSEFVDDLIGIKAVEERTVYLYEDTDAEIFAQRLSFFRSLSTSVIKLKTAMSLSKTVVGDKLYLSLERLYKRYSGSVQARIGVVSGIKKDGYGCDVSVSDLGNIYNRVMSIAPNSTLDYSNSTDDDKIKWCYIVDSQTLTPDATSEIGLGSNLIG